MYRIFCKCFILLLVSVLIVSCKLSLYRDNVRDTKLDLSKLEDKNGRYGVAILRSMFLYKKDSSQTDCETKFSNLDSKNQLEVYVRHASLNSFSNTPYGYTINSKHQYIYDDDLDGLAVKNQNIKKIKHSGGYIDLLPDYFYGVTILPEGRYFIETMSSIMPENTKYYLEKKYYKGEVTYYFDIKFGEVTYIGDYYRMNPSYSMNEKLQGAFVAKNKLCDRREEAKNFFYKHYPDINLKFTVNLIKCCKPIPSYSKTILHTLMGI
ncbi:MAG: hypothetical protein ACI8ZF_000072 [Candidatus Midichloriaceae bacterium]|jgi:hypothetical protein